MFIVCSASFPISHVCTGSAPVRNHPQGSISRLTRRSTYCSMAMFLVSAASSWAQPLLDIRPSHSGVEAFRSPDLRVNVNLVLLPVIVTNRAGATVDGLTASSFTILEDNRPVPVTSFGKEDVACSVGVVVDLSGSMQSKAGIAGRAMHAFFDTANPED